MLFFSALSHVLHGQVLRGAQHSHESVRGPFTKHAGHVIALSLSLILSRVVSVCSKNLWRGGSEVCRTFSAVFQNKYLAFFKTGCQRRAPDEISRGEPARNKKINFRRLPEYFPSTCAAIDDRSATPKSSRTSDPIIFKKLNKEDF